MFRAVERNARPRSERAHARASQCGAASIKQAAIHGATVSRETPDLGYSRTSSSFELRSKTEGKRSDEHRQGGEEETREGERAPNEDKEEKEDRERERRNNVGTKERESEEEKEREERIEDRKRGETTLKERERERKREWNKRRDELKVERVSEEKKEAR